MISKMLKKNEKGFTLMEMLIVVAIIAVLIAIAIPTFNSSLNRAKVATDEANIRSGYASVMLEIIDNEPAADQDYILQKDGSVATTSTNDYTTVGKNDDDVSIGGIAVTGGWGKDDTVTYSYSRATGAITIKVGD